MPFPFASPSKRAWWVWRSTAEELHICTALSASGGWQMVQHHGRGLPGWGGDCLVCKLSHHLWLQGLAHLKDQNLGILIRPSTDFNQQGSDEMIEALIVVPVTAAHFESWFQLSEASSYSPLPLSPCPNSWGLSILTSKDIGFVCLFVVHNVSMTFLKQSVQWASESWKISV